MSLTFSSMNRSNILSYHKNKEAGRACSRSACRGSSRFYMAVRMERPGQARPGQGLLRLIVTSCENSGSRPLRQSWPLAQAALTLRLIIYRIFLFVFITINCPRSLVARLQL